METPMNENNPINQSPVQQPAPAPASFQPPQIPNPVQPAPAPVMQSAPGGFTGNLEYYFVAKAPFQIPPNIKEIIVKFGPWLVVLGVVMSLPMALSFLGLRSMSMYSFGYAPFMGGRYSFYLIIAVITLVMHAIALPGLFSRKMFGWNMLFYSTLVSIAGSLLSFSILSAVLSAVIGLYVLFQVRSYYH